MSSPSPLFIYLVYLSMICPVITLCSLRHAPGPFDTKYFHVVFYEDCLVWFGLAVFCICVPLFFFVFFFSGVVESSDAHCP